MTQERYVYLVGDFFAKYHGRRLPHSDVRDGLEYEVITYDHKVSHAEFVWDPELPEPDPVNCMRPDVLQQVEIYFDHDPAGYGKPFREDLRAPIIAGIKLEGVYKEHKRSFGTLRGRLYVKVHTVAL